MTRISRSLLCLAVAIAGIVGSGHFNLASAQTGTWPNEPPGFTPLLDCPLSGSLCPGMWDAYNSVTWAPGVNTPPPSSSVVLDQYMAAGSTTGSGQFGMSLPNVKELFFGTWWSTNPEFQGNINNSNKMIFFRDPAIDNSLLNWYGLQDQPRTVTWFFQTTYDECHVSGYVGGCYNRGDGTGYLTANVNAAAATVRAGSGWHRIELYLKASTTRTSQDGTIRIWVDGVLTHNYNTVNLTPTGINDFQFNTAWDGSSSYTAAGRDMSRAWHHFYHNARISIGQAKPTSDQPPGPPAVPSVRSVTVP